MQLFDAGCLTLAVALSASPATIPSKAHWTFSASPSAKFVRSLHLRGEHPLDEKAR